MRLAKCQFCLFFLVLGTATGLADEPLPNFVFIMADDMTFRDIGCYGGQAHTPNIDRLAQEGMKFNKCFQAAPMCSPTRHNIYTGLYPVKSGAYPNHTFAKPDTLSVVQYLKPLGYRVALSGKTHIGPRKTFPFEYSGKKNPDMNAIDDLFESCRKTKTPFCLFACSNEPHSPWDKGDLSRYSPEKVQLPPYIADTPVVRQLFCQYLAEVTYFDDQVGQILAMLKQHQLVDNTMVVVVSEQGNGFPFAKWTCYGNGLQSAMIVRWPGQVASKTETDALVEYVDILPTFVEAAGGTPAAELDGKSLLYVLQGKSTQHKKQVFGIMTTRGIINGSQAYGIRTIRNQRYRLIWNLHYETKFTNACTSGAAFQSMVQAANSGDLNARKIVDRYHYRPQFELYDCQADPLELNNLIDQADLQPIVVQLKSGLQKWMADQGDQGVETELDALARQRRYAGLTREAAMAKWKSKSKKAQNQK